MSNVVPSGSICTNALDNAPSTRLNGIHHDHQVSEVRLVIEFHRTGSS
jgi:hypothetical protein